MWSLRPLLPHFLYVWLFCLFQNLLTSLCPCGVTTMTLWAGFCQTSTPKPCRTEALLSVLCVLQEERQLLVINNKCKWKEKCYFLPEPCPATLQNQPGIKTGCITLLKEKKHCVKCFTETSVYFQMAFTTPKPKPYSNANFWFALHFTNTFLIQSDIYTWENEPCRSLTEWKQILHDVISR